MPADGLAPLCFRAFKGTAIKLILDFVSVEACKALHCLDMAIYEYIARFVEFW